MPVSRSRIAGIQSQPSVATKVGPSRPWYRRFLPGPAQDGPVHEECRDAAGATLSPAARWSGLASAGRLRQIRPNECTLSGPQRLPVQPHFRGVVDTFEGQRLPSSARCFRRLELISVPVVLLIQTLRNGEVVQPVVRRDTPHGRSWSSEPYPELSRPASPLYRSRVLRCLALRLSQSARPPFAIRRPSSTGCRRQVDATLDSWATMARSYGARPLDRSRDPAEHDSPLARESAQATTSAPSSYSIREYGGGLAASCLIRSADKASRTIVKPAIFPPKCCPSAPARRGRKLQYRSNSP